MDTDERGQGRFTMIVRARRRRFLKSRSCGSGEAHFFEKIMEVDGL
jgi:hypothetical protein